MVVALDNTTNHEMLLEKLAVFSDGDIIAMVLFLFNWSTTLCQLKRAELVLPS